jgi:cytochrome P450
MARTVAERSFRLGGLAPALVPGWRRDAHLEDPFAVLAALDASERPVFYAPAIDYYVVTRQEDIEAVFTDHDSYSAAAAQVPLTPLVDEAARILAGGGHRPQPSMVSLDQPEHTRVRRHTARAFTPRRVASMADTIRATARELLDAVDAGRPFDLVPALTFPLPATTIFTLIGVPPEDYGQLKRWCANRAALTFGRSEPDEQVAHADNIVAYRRYLRALVDDRHAERAGDLTSALVDIHDEDPEAFTLDEIGSILFSLSFAGRETTNYLIGNLVRRLLEEPARWDRVVADPSLIPGAVEETLRFDPSVAAWRPITRRAVTLGGVELPAGAKVMLWLAAAGRDPAVFDDLDSFDPQRANARRHLAFGRGIHFCLGSSLGRLEAELALAELTTRFPGLRLVEGQELSFSPNISFRGPQALWVRAGA